MSDTYGDVDGSVDPGAAVQGQLVVDSWPQIKAYKRGMQDRLDGATKVLDVGCGPGTDVVELGTERAIGLDRSAVMCDATRAQGARICRGDGGRLPFAAASFDGVRADRVLQHVADPAVVLDELRRVLRPGGRLVLADPDQETLVVHVPGVRQELTDRIKRLRRDVGYRNGRLASSLPAALLARGFVGVSVEAFPLVLTDPDDAFGLPGWPAYWREVGGFTDQDLEEWDAGMVRSAGGGFVYSVVYLVVSGRAVDH